MILKTSKYPIYFYENYNELIKKLLSLHKTLYIFDEFFFRLWNNHFGDVPKEKYLIIPSGEKYKNIENLQRIWKFLCKNEADRNTNLICIGGGVIGDMGGFAAATYMRGIPFIQVPTTLLSMVDSSVGGKTAIDFENYKNTIGAFYFPKMVLICNEFLNTLSERQILAGQAEMFKHAVIHEKNHLNNLKIITLQSIYHSVKIKNFFVEKDPYEKDIRKALNFGHTLGHAFESYALKNHMDLLHGEAVWWGMFWEMYFFEKFHWIETSVFQEFQQLINGNLQKMNFQIDKECIKASLPLIALDKKKVNQDLVLPVIKKIGHFELKKVNIKEFIKKIEEML